MGNFPRDLDGGVPMLFFMKEMWRKRLAEVIDRRGIPLKKLSIGAGLNETFLRDVLKEGATPSVTKLEAVADQLGLPMAYLFGGEVEERPSVPVVGYVSGGDRWVPVDDFAKGDGIETIQFDLPDDDHVAVRVRGHSMAPVYRDGDDLLCSRLYGTEMSKAVNRDCVIKTAANEMYIKILMRGGQRNSYRLRSYNPAFEDVDSVALEWAAPVVWVRRNG
jgi:phage repressor protein C with HTH and peptisase S24 domain